MSDAERHARGIQAIEDVYAGQVPIAPRGTSDFLDLMVEGVFAEVWTRKTLPIRDRRLLVMGVIAAVGDASTWKIQARAALENGELDADQVRETLIQLAQYAGYPRVAQMVAATEQAIAEWSESKGAG